MKKIEQEGRRIKKTTRGREKVVRTEDNEKKHLATLKRLKRGDEKL